MVIYWVQRHTVCEPLYANIRKSLVIRYVSENKLGEKVALYSATVRKFDYRDIISTVVPPHLQSFETFCYLAFVRYLYKHNDERVKARYIKNIDYLLDFFTYE